MTSPSDSLLKTRPLDLAMVPFVAVAAAMAVGGFTNAINGLVSAPYFMVVMGWEQESIWPAAIAQGIFEGAFIGVLLALVFTTVGGVMTGARAPLRFYARHIGGVLVGTLACWALAGAFAVVLCLLSPEWYQQAFRGVPTESGTMVRFAWVGGGDLGRPAGWIGLHLRWIGDSSFPMGQDRERRALTLAR